METFSVKVSIGDKERRQWIDLSATVDTGAFMMSVPGSMLRKLGIVPSCTRDFRTPDGGVRSMDVAYTWIQANHREAMTFIVLGDEHSEPVMGRLAVNSLILTADPVEQRLIPMDSILL